MSFKKILMTASALTLLGANAFADGGPVPEPPAPPPEPAAPPPEEEPAPPPLAEEPAPPPAPFSKWYVGAFGGIVWMADELQLETPALPVNEPLPETDLDMGWGIGGMLGRRWENGFRTEFEVSLRYNDGEIGGEFRQAEPFDIEVDSLSVMFDLLYDVNLDSLLVPYLGVGLGTSRVSVDIESVEDEDWAFAYQFLGGFSVPIPNSAVELFVDYRYLSTLDLHLEELRPLLVVDGAVDDGDDYQTHNVMAGFRFNF